LFSDFDREVKTTFLVIISSSALLVSLAIKISDCAGNNVEVYDGGVFLAVKHRHKVETVPISNIAKVAWVRRSVWVHGAVPLSRITILLVQPRQGGQTIRFIPRDPDVEKIARNLQQRALIARRISKIEAPMTSGPSLDE
jgi:hypothetical protein